MSLLQDNSSEIFTLDVLDEGHISSISPSLSTLHPGRWTNQFAPISTPIPILTPIPITTPVPFSTHPAPLTSGATLGPQFGPGAGFPYGQN